MRMVGIRCQVQRHSGLCHVSTAYWPGLLMTHAEQLEVSEATHTAASGAQLHALSTLSLSSPYLSIGTRPWLAATPVPTKDSLTAKDSNAHCWSLQGLPLWALDWLKHQGLSLFPPSGLPRLRVRILESLQDWIPFLGPWYSPWYPQGPGPLWTNIPATNGLISPKSWAPWSILLETATLRPNSIAGRSDSHCLWMNAQTGMHSRHTTRCWQAPSPTNSHITQGHIKWWASRVAVWGARL